MEIYSLISELCDYAVERGLISELDRAYAVGSLMDILRLSDFKEEERAAKRPLAAILDEICNYAFSEGIIDSDGVVTRDLFDTKIMGALTPRPSEVIGKFETLYATSPEAATDMFYSLACDSNYIRRDRIEKDMKWRVDSDYGEIDISINLSKPEKDPKAIAMARLMPSTDYPRCALCHENEGFAGSLTKAARQTLRQIPFDMAGERWYLQYSPYVYYNEHCIALSAAHEPMKIDRQSFEKALDFVSVFPHYFIGQNADLPIVGGSILSHDHMQGGAYTFAMAKAPIKQKVTFKGFEGVSAGIVYWPMSVLRLESEKKEDLVLLADKILSAWREYSDESAEILAFSNGEPHNTITPIARRAGEAYQLDLVLRNNRTTDEHPLGLFHPHAELHNIKKENIGLIEVMGLAVLPARLKDEMEALAEALVSGADLSLSEKTAKHASWVDTFKENYKITKENVRPILFEQIGKTFVRVLEDAGVYKNTEAGNAAFLRFVDAVNAKS